MTRNRDVGGLRQWVKITTLIVYNMSDDLVSNSPARCQRWKYRTMFQKGVIEPEGVKRYPAPRIVIIHRGVPGSTSSLRRRR
jgi:hypothetical protein